MLQLWATAHGLIALRVVGRVDVDGAALHALLDDALTDCLARALAANSQVPADDALAERRASSRRNREGHLNVRLDVEHGGTWPAAPRPGAIRPRPEAIRSA
jgi:hypothetical protein